MTEKKTINEYIKEGLISLKNIKKDKAEYKAYLARVDVLPKDYKKVYEAVSQYIWSYSDTSGHSALNVVGGLLELFEEGVAEGRTVKEVTGDDIGEFAEGLAKEIDNSWISASKEKLTQKFKDL
jgi:DNA-binding ferritin-like protein (Dps family)